MLIACSCSPVRKNCPLVLIAGRLLLYPPSQKAPPEGKDLHNKLKNFFKVSCSNSFSSSASEAGLA